MRRTVCGSRRTRIGPDVWLSAALARAHSIPGVRAFLYTGAGGDHGRNRRPGDAVVPYARSSTATRRSSHELQRVPRSSPTDLDGADSEQLFEEAFSGFPRPFGEAAPTGKLSERAPKGKAAMGPRAARPATRSTRPQLRGKCAWSCSTTRRRRRGSPGRVARQAARGRQESAEPAIVVGHADLNAQIAAGGETAAVASRVARAIVAAAGRSAYFYDSPEKNVKLPSLRAGGARNPDLRHWHARLRQFDERRSGWRLHRREWVPAGQGRRGRTRPANATRAGQREADPGRRRTGDGSDRRHAAAPQPSGAVRSTRTPTALGQRCKRRIRRRPDEPLHPISSNSSCVGNECSKGVLPEFSFSSSNTEVGDFVDQNLATGNPRAVLLGSNGKPIPNHESGLFCAYARVPPASPSAPVG